MSAHHQRQMIATLRPSTSFANAPAGHSVTTIGDVHLCACKLVRTSVAGMVEHHDNVRDEQAALAMGRMRTSMQTITLDEITAAYRAAGGAE